MKIIIRGNFIYFLLIYFLIFNFKAFSQKSKIDSLKILLENTDVDSEKVEIYFDLSWELIYLGDYESSKNNALAAQQLSEKLGFKKGVARSFGIIGNINHEIGNFPEALKNHFTALKIYDELGYKFGIASSYHFIGLIFSTQSNYNEALNYYLIALKISEEIGAKGRIADINHNIGNIYLEQGKYGEALEKFNKSLKLFYDLKDKEGIAVSYLNIGKIYSIQGNYSNALDNLLKALKVMEEMQFKSGIVTSYLEIGLIKMRQNNNHDAKKYFKDGLKIAIAIENKENIRDCFFCIAQIDSAMTNFKSAYENFKLYLRYRDSLVNEVNTKQTVQTQMRYEFDKKEAITKVAHDKQIAIVEEEKKKQKIITYTVVSGLLLVALFSGLIFRSLRITKRQKHIIELQKNEVSRQKDLVEAHQKEIIDSITYAKRLQQAILPPSELIKKHFPHCFIFYKPKDIVAGDFYWMEFINNTVFIAAADCTGHGVPGAMVSVVCSNALNRTIKEFALYDTGKILDKVTDLVLETFEKSASEVKDGMDISLLAYNVTSKQIQWSGANNPLWYIQNGQVVEIKADKQPVGKFDMRKPFTTRIIEHSDNSVFYLFTDGLPDQFGGPKGKKFMYKRFENNLSYISKLPMDEQQAVLEKAFQDWKGGLEQVDDVTVIGIKI